MRASPSSVSGGTSSRTVATRAERSEAAAANLPWLFTENSLSGPAILIPEPTSRNLPVVDPPCPLCVDSSRYECANSGMSGRRPVVKGCFEAVVNVSSAVMSTAC
jgi:hypothetical protein